MHCVFNAHSPGDIARISPDGKQVASADEGGFVRVWDRDSLKQKVAEQISGAAVRDIAFHPGGKFLVVCGDARGSYAKVIKIPSAGSAGVCQGHTKRVIACDVNPKDPAFVATASEDMSVGLFKGPPVREIDIPKFLKNHAGFVNDVRFSPCGTMLATASSDRTVTITNVNNFDVICKLEAHTASVTGLSWSMDSKQLLTSSNDKSTRLWNIPSAECISVVEYGKDVMNMQTGCALLPCADRFVSVSLSGDLSFTSLSAARPDTIFRGHAKQIVGIAVVAGKAYSADYSGLMVAWDVGIGSSTLHFNGKGPTTSVCAVGANDRIVANVGQDGKVFITPTSSLTYPKPVTLKGGGTDIAVPANSTAAFSAFVVNEVRMAIVSLDGCELLVQDAFARGATGCSVATTADGSLLAVGLELSGGSGELRFFTFKAGELDPTGKTIRMPSPPNKLAFSPDMTLIAVGEKSRRVKMYDCQTGESVTGGGVAHTARVDAVAFAPDGSRLATGGMDGSVAIWPVNSEEDPARLQGAHRNGVTGIGFVDATTLMTSGGDSCLRTWTV